MNIKKIEKPATNKIYNSSVFRFSIPIYLSLSSFLPFLYLSICSLSPSLSGINTLCSFILPNLFLTSLYLSPILSLPIPLYLSISSSLSLSLSPPLSIFLRIPIYIFLPILISISPSLYLPTYSYLYPPPNASSIYFPIPISIYLPISFSTPRLLIISLSTLPSLTLSVTIIQLVHLIHSLLIPPFSATQFNNDFDYSISHLSDYSREFSRVIHLFIYDTP